MENLKVTIIQSDIIWEDIDSNLKLFQSHLDKVDETDLIVLPEMFTTGFSMNASALAQESDEKALNWLIRNAKTKNAVIGGSIIVDEDGKFFNRFYWANPDGTFGKYDKRHLFRMASENNTYSGGKERVIFDIKGWKIMPLICYDLRFPVWSRNRNDYDVLLYVANWPKRRRYTWKVLLKARAMENQSYVVGVNRIGKDGPGNLYSGDSMVIDLKGHIISKTEANALSIETISLSYDNMLRMRKNFPAHLDSDNFNIEF